MTQSSIGGFFTGGGKGITWPDEPGKDGGRTMVTGTITAIHPPEEIMSIATPTRPSEPTGKFQVRIELDTDERDPEAEYDDGARTLYVKSFLRGAVGDALRKAGEKEPKIGGKLTVRFVRTEPPERPGLSASKHFEAEYAPPSTTGGFFSNGGQSASHAPQQQTVMQPPPQLVKPPGITDAAWEAMDSTTKQAVANTMASMSSNEPPF